MSECWKSQKFEQLAQFRNGRSIKPGGEGQYPVYGSNGIIGKSDEFMYSNALILGRVGAYCGSVMYSKSMFWASDNTIVVEAVPEKIDIKFLYYMLVDANLNRHAGGAAQPLLTQSRLKPLEFKVPSLPTQRHIASILSTYDDLIENNTRRIEILEEMARRLYEEWFVRFRFPGHEKIAPTDELPSGWESVRLDSVADANPESIKPRTAPENIKYIDIASVSPGRIDQVQPMPFNEAPSRARRKVQSEDIIWSCVRPNRRSHALILEPEPDTIASTGFAVLRATGVPFSYLYQAVRTDEFVQYLINHATGAAYPAVKVADFEAAEIVLPSRDILDAFHEKVEPMLRLGHLLDRKNANLRAQRDLLLPKLISGQIDVSQAEEMTEEVAA